MDLVEYAWIIWLVVALVFFIIEMVTLEFTFLMLGMSSVVGLVGSITGLPWWAQILVAAAAALLLLLLVRPKLLQRLHDSGETNKQGIEALLGMAGEVTRSFERGAGEVTLVNGDIWTSRLSPAVQPRDPDVGERIIVTAIEGATAIVVPAQR